MTQQASGSVWLRRSSLFIAIGGLVLFAGCSGGKVTKPRSDATPPSLTWNVFNFQTNAQADHTGNPTLSASHGERYRIILKAKDSGGIQSIQINPSVGSGHIAWTCESSDLGQNKNATLGPQVQNFSPDANNKVLPSVFLIQELNFDLECQPGWTFKGGTAMLTGQASNYFNGVTTRTITFNISP